MAKENQKVRKTNEKLMEAVSNLLQTSSLTEISVSSLCKEAKISRATFYRHYSVPSEVIGDYFGNLFLRAFASEASAHMTLRESIYRIILIMCQEYRKYPKFLKGSSLSFTDISAIIKKVLPPASKGGTVLGNSRYAFISGGFTSLVFQWADRGFQDTPEAIAEAATDMAWKLLKE